MLPTSAFVWVVGPRPGLNRAENLIYPQFFGQIRVCASGRPMCRVWNAACITKVTCDGWPSKKIPGPKEHDNEGKNECKSGNQDCDSDGRNGRHLRRSRRSAGSRCGWGPAHFVPSQNTKLPSLPPIS